MRLALTIATLAVLGGPALAQSEAATSSPDAPRVEGPANAQSHRQTLSGAINRADHKLADWFYRGIELREQNTGLNGRKNATNDAAQDTDTPRAARQNGNDFSEWQRW